MHMSDSICNGRRWIHLCISYFPFFSITCFCKYSEIPLISHTQNRSYNVSELFWSVLFMRLSSGVFVFTLMKRCDRFATMLISCVSLCVWWSWLRSSDWKDFYLWSFCLAAFFFSSHQSSFNIYSTSLTPFFEYASFLIKRVALLYWDFWNYL